MSTPMRHRANPIAELLSRFDLEPGMGLAPSVRVEDYVEGDTYVLRAELPGIDPDKDVEITVDRDVLTISGERREEVKERNRQEMHYGSFMRSVTLPGDAREKDISASYADGVLEVRVPFDEDQDRTRRIPVRRAES
ncbi:Hsp20/alpha crystallin family protein [Nocardioides sediminis]|uniref:Hsp20/alpha crystallin family protein n=1 Tax=Nocardioides sediminis TaxID=433648 RepID=UPI000D2F60DC|nr:Hsp20/alpha crystallin family protein [Nocardioides sediminis]